MKLSEAQLEALRKIDKWGYSARIKFRTGEALRRLGLVNRYTTYNVRAVFANADGEHEQYSRPADDPILVHEWDLTSAGRSTLTHTKGEDNE